MTVSDITKRVLPYLVVIKDVFDRTHIVNFVTITYFREEKDQRTIENCYQLSALLGFLNV